VVIVFRLLHIARALLTCCLAYNRRTSLVTARIASAFLAMISDGGSISVILKYKLKTSNVRTILSGLAELLTVLTAIYKIIFLLICLSLSFFFMILYARHNNT
jgi:hypothetical protein